ncbi:YDG domain-containing protein, partial [Hyphomonas beringensis]|uniref:YDG domain-containing protein n=1 Tax=Hyphomonas beringensis TaxID=1280946 RepID=UPI00054EECA7
MTVDLTGGTLVGVMAGDAGTVTLNVDDAAGVMADKDAGTGKTVTASGYLLEGADKDNYVLSQPTGLTVDVAKAQLTVEGVTTEDRVYNKLRDQDISGGTLSDGVVSGDVVVLSVDNAQGKFDDKNAGVNKPVTVSGFAITGSGAKNYQLVQPDYLTATVSKLDVTIGGVGITGTSREYNGLTSIDGLFGGEVVGKLDGDSISPDWQNAKGEFDSKNVGIRTVTITGYALQGSAAVNYNLVQQPGPLSYEITPKRLTVTGAVVADRVYDGTLDAKLLSIETLDGVVADDVGDVAVDVEASKAVFTRKDAGNALASITYALTGDEAENYYFAYPDSARAVIEKKELTVTGASVANRVY